MDNILVFPRREIFKLQFNFLFCQLTGKLSQYLVFPTKLLDLQPDQNLVIVH